MNKSSNTLTIKSHRILSQNEIDIILQDLHAKSGRSKHAFANLVIFRLAAFVGLRVSELVGLRLRDVILDIERPYVSVPKEIAKLHKSRVVPIWSAATIAELKAWKTHRVAMGAKEGDWFLCSLHSDTCGSKVDRRAARLRWQTACKPLGRERSLGTTIHDGRHLFCSQGLAKGIPLAAVKDAAGHASIHTTNVYTHLFPIAERTYSLD